MSRPSGLSPAARTVALGAFTLSGIAGLVYEVVWSRYLALLVGSGAYGQVAVLAGTLGGMAIGAFAVGRITHRFPNPLRAYAWTEAALAVSGWLFHPAFLFASEVVDGAVLPLAGGGAGVALRWSLAAALVLPGAVLLGATFPLFAAGLVRSDPARPGGGVATAYLANTLGAAAGVLLAGFVLIPALGLPGALASAAALNGASALLVGVVARRETGTAPAAAGPVATADEGAKGAHARRALLVVCFGTAVASFGYEIAWTRMLALSLGSATHAFEIMLSAFILGIAFGALLVRSVVDAPERRLRLIGVVQVLMGVAAVATLPLYVGSFEAVGFLAAALRQGGEGGYALFNLTRYVLGLLIMLPATTLAGMTLPLLVAALIAGGAGERAIARAYAWNTLGAVVGVSLAALVLMPSIGLERLLVGAAGLDIALGVWVLVLAAPAAARRRGPVLAGAAALSASVAVSWAVYLDPVVLSSAAFRYGVIPARDSREMLFHRDGRTATVSAYRDLGSGQVTLATNGKPDASLEPPFLLAGRDTMAPLPLGEASDAGTQILLPLMGLAYAPDARRVAAIGHGSGVSTTTLLTGPGVREVVTLEIEPAMVEASRVFLPANRPALEDPRSVLAYGDARILLAYGEGAFELIMSEPSNPWVSGNAGLFTKEFYARLRRSLAPGGVLAQWVQLYEVDDALALTVVSALGEAFPHYRAYLVGDRDMVLIARADEPLPGPDWSVARTPGALTVMEGVSVPGPGALDALLLFDDRLMRPALASGVAANSDFRPVLEYGAERTRFEGRVADGILALGTARVDPTRIAAGWRVPPWADEGGVFARGLAPMVRAAKATWLHRRLRGDPAAPPPPGFEDWSFEASAARAFEEELVVGAPPESWDAWSAAFVVAEERLHGGTSGWADTVFFARVGEALDRWQAPEGVRLTVAVLRGVDTWDFAEVAASIDALQAGERPAHVALPERLLLEAGVVAFALTGRSADARTALARAGADLPEVRRRLLEAFVAWAEAGG